MIKKIEDKKDRMNDVDRKRVLRKETKVKEKNKLLEIEEEIRCRIIDLSYRKLKERVWIGIEKMFEKNKEIIIRKIKELVEESASRLFESIIIIRRKVGNNTLSEIKVNEMMISISKTIIKKLEHNNWYRRLVKGWESRVKTEREVKLRYRGLSRMKNKRRHKEDEEKDRRNYEDERKKRNWYIVRDEKLPCVKLIKDTSKEQVLLYLAKTYYSSSSCCSSSSSIVIY